jgi:carboxyl-terminal processing protease
MSLRKKIIFVFLLGTLFGGSFYGGILVGKSQCKICPPEDIDFSLFWEAYHKLKEKFVDQGKLDPQKILYGAISGMTQSLEDPYTVFFSPEENKKFQEEVKGTFEGVGMEVGIKKGQLQVIAPLEGTPAQKAGLRAGDKILKINDTPTSNLTLDEAVNLIRGPKGTKVKLTIYREGWSESKDFEIVRAVIEIPSLKWEMKDGIVYLKIYQFTEKAALDFARAAIEILAKPSQKMILDLRDNPGGYLEVAQDIAGWFLEKGEIVAIEDFGNGKTKEYKSEGPARFLDYKIVVLINQGSASGAEILAGALRDNRGILLIGEKSFGKGSVQEVENLKGGSSLKITVAKWLTPKGKSISETGLTPDIEVKMTEKDVEEGKDPQLEKAIEILKEMK